MKLNGNLQFINFFTFPFQSISVLSDSNLQIAFQFYYSMLSKKRLQNKGTLANFTNEESKYVFRFRHGNKVAICYICMSSQQLANTYPMSLELSWNSVLFFNSHHHANLVRNCKFFLKIHRNIVLLTCKIVHTGASKRTRRCFKDQV